MQRRPLLFVICLASVASLILAYNALASSNNFQVYSSESLTETFVSHFIGLLASSSNESNFSTPVRDWNPSFGMNFNKLDKIGILDLLFPSKPWEQPFGDEALSNHSSGLVQENVENKPYRLCTDPFIGEQKAAILCTFQICNQIDGIDGVDSEVRVDNLKNVDLTRIVPNCTYSKLLSRVPNKYFEKEQEENLRSPGSLVMYPDSKFTENSGCEAWFFQDSGNRNRFEVYTQKYMDLKIPTTGISSRIYYSPPKINFLSLNKQTQRYLVVYACSTLNRYRAVVTKFNLQRLRAVFGNDAFIIVVDTVIGSWLHEEVSNLADVIIYADFVSSETFYDSAAIQEGMMEAYRLFGLQLLGFGALLVVNDSVIGPLTSTFPKVLDQYPRDQKIFIALGVWPGSNIGGFGFSVNREAFLTSTFSEYWRYMRFFCGKWGSMALYEGGLFPSIVQHGGMSCYTFTNDIMSVSISADLWKGHGLPYYKHKNKASPEDVLNFIQSYNSTYHSDFSANENLKPLERCAL